MVRPTCKVNEKGWILTPQWHQNPLNFSNLNLTFMIMSPRFTPVQIFISIHSAGGFSPDRWNITALWWLLGYTVFFLGHARAVCRTCGWIFRVYGSYNVFSPKDGPLGGGLRQYDRNSFGGNSPHKKGVRIANLQPKRAECENRNILQSIITIKM